MFINPSRRTPPTHFLYRIPPLNAARFWLARKGRTRCFSVSVRANRLRRWSVHCCTRKRRTTFCSLCAKPVQTTRCFAPTAAAFSHLCHGYDLSPVCLCAFLTAEGRYSGNTHCTLEHQLETLHYRREGHATGLPVQMGGFAALDDAQRKRLPPRFPLRFRASSLTPRFRRAFGNLFFDAVSLCRLLRSEDGRRFRTWGSVLSPFKLDATLHAHMMPAEPPTEDIANDAHTPWASIWVPDEIRHDSFDDLFAASVSRSEELMTAADSLMKGRGSYAALRSLHGGLSYDSGLPWQETCPPSQAPGVKR